MSTANTSANGQQILPPAPQNADNAPAQGSALAGFTQGFADLLNAAENVLNTLGNYGVGPAAPQTPAPVAQSGGMNTGTVIAIGVAVVGMILVLR